jgi:hypothetical protein
MTKRRSECCLIFCLFLQSVTENHFGNIFRATKSSDWEVDFIDIYHNLLVHLNVMIFIIIHSLLQRSACVILAKSAYFALCMNINIGTKSTHTHILFSLGLCCNSQHILLHILCSNEVGLKMINSKLVVVFLGLFHILIMTVTQWDMEKPWRSSCNGNSAGTLTRYLRTSLITAIPTWSPLLNWNTWKWYFL